MVQEKRRVEMSYHESGRITEGCSLRRKQQYKVPCSLAVSFGAYSQRQMVITDSRKIFIMEMKFSKLNNNRLSLQVITQRVKIFGKRTLHRENCISVFPKNTQKGSASLVFLKKACPGWIQRNKEI